MEAVTRRTLLTFGTAIIAAPTFAFSQQRTRPPAIAADVVKEFVGAGHNNLDRVKEMLGNDPALLNETTDHGGGDFEAAIGGAGHMGNRDIALFLIDQGARYDIFVAAMLGDLETVQAMAKARPAVLKSKGPHGIPLLRHAERGGDPAAKVAEWLKSQAI